MRITAASCSTVTVALDITSFPDTVMLALPLPTAVTSPEASTVATDSLSDDHVRPSGASFTGWPLASIPDALIRSVAPSARSVSAEGDSCTSTTSCATVNPARPEAGPDAAVMIALPLSTAVTNPEASTVTTDSLFDSQRKPGRSIAWPLASNAWPDNRNVSPSAVSRS